MAASGIPKLKYWGFSSSNWLVRIDSSTTSLPILLSTCDLKIARRHSNMSCLILMFVIVHCSLEHDQYLRDIRNHPLMLVGIESFNWRRHILCMCCCMANNLISPTFLNHLNQQLNFRARTSKCTNLQLPYAGV